MDGALSSGPGRLAAAIRSGRFVVTAELSPPRGAGGETFRRKARDLREWVDAANVTDNQGAMTRLASWAGCALAMQEGLEPVMQLQTRDRNRNALQSDLLGAAAIGVPNVLLLSGDHVRFGDHPDALPVYDLDSVQLVATAKGLRDGKLLSGKAVNPRPEWLIGAVENPFAPPLPYRADRLAKKVAAGAQFVQTQFVFDLGIFRRFMERVNALDLPRRCAVIAGVGPIRSAGALHRMQQIPGIVIPPEIVRRLQGVPETRLLDESITLCAETIAELRAMPGVAGVHIMAFSLEEAIPEIITRAGLAAQRPSALPAP